MLIAELMSSAKPSKIPHLREVENVRGWTNIAFCVWKMYFATWFPVMSPATISRGFTGFAIV
jgi:hypothetical protein